MDIKNVVEILPPMTANMRWRTLVSIAIIALMFHVFWSMGLVPGLEGYAQTTQIQSVEKKLDDNSAKYTAAIEDVRRSQTNIIVRLIASDAENARTQQCKALKEKRPDAAEGWRARLLSSLAEYQQAAGYGYRLRDCTEY